MISWVWLLALAIASLIALLVCYKHAYNRGFRHGGMFSEIVANAELIGHKKQEEEMLNAVMTQLPMGSEEETCERH